MAVSQNGWPANDRGVIKYWRAGHNQVLLSSRRGDVQTVMEYVANRFDAEVHRLVQKHGQWGYAERPIRGGTALPSPRWRGRFAAARPAPPLTMKRTRWSTPAWARPAAKT